MSSCSSGSALSCNNLEGFNKPTDFNTFSCLKALLPDVFTPEESSRPLEAIETKEMAKIREAGRSTFADSILNVCAISK
jgi:hypothetical protein